MTQARGLGWVIAVACACGSSGPTGSTTPPPRGGANGSCEERDGIRAMDLDATPRPDRATERLALTISRGITAEPAVYDRLARDLAAMRRADPSIAQLEYRGEDDGRTLFLIVETDGPTWIREHPAFDALRRRFRAPAPTFPMGWVTLAFDDVLALRRVGAYFQRIPGVREVGTNVLVGDGPTICVEPGADLWTTYFVDAGGDCPAGCTTLRLVVFTSTAAGAITRVGEADPEHGGDARLLEGMNRCMLRQRDRDQGFAPACP